MRKVSCGIIAFLSMHCMFAQQIAPKRYERYISQNKQPVSKNALYSLKDSTYVYRYEPVFGGGYTWKVFQTEVFQYNSQNMEIGSVYQQNYYITKTYDSNNYQIEKTTRFKSPISPSVLVNDSRELDTRDANGNSLIWLRQNWDANTLNWKNDNQFVSTYDANNNILNCVQQTWNSATNSWKNATRDFCIYNTSNELIRYHNELFNQNTGMWDINACDSNIVYTNGKLKSYETYTWDASTQLYKPFRKLMYTYDANGNMVNLDVYVWETAVSTWVFLGNDEQTYDIYGNLTHVDSYDENHNNLLPWVRKIRHYYSTYVGLNESSGANAEIIVYPNPTNNILTIQSTVNQTTSYEIVDVLGKVVMHGKKETGNFSLDVSDLHTGIYFMRLSTGNKLTVRKFVKE